MNGPRLLPFVRYAEKTDFLPNRDFTYAYDCRLLYCLSGRGTLSFSDSIHPLVPGTLCLYPAGTRYLPCSAEEDPMQFIILNFDYYDSHSEQEGPFEPVMQENFVPHRVIGTWRDTRELSFTQPQVLPGFQSVENELLDIVHEWQIKKLHCQEIVSSLLALVLYRVLQRASAGPQGSQRADELLDFIHVHYSQHLDYNVIAEHLHYHPYYLNSLMKARTGQSLHRYIMNYRVREACRLLTCTQDSVGEISRAVGFENKDHFSTCFKKAIGVSPLQYRKGHNI